MKKVVFVNSSLTGGGSEKVMVLLANYICKRGYDVTMILLRNKKKTYKLEKNIKCIQLEYKYNNKLYIMLARIVKLRNIFKELNPDTIISFMVDINCFSLLSNIGLKNRMIISERANPFIKRKLSNKLGEKLLYPLTDKIVFQTEMVKDYYSENIRKKGVVIPNPIEIESSKSECEIKKSKIILAAGRLTQQKNFEMLVDAFDKFYSVNDQYQLHIYGDGPLREQLQGYIDKKESSSYIKLMGYCPNINQKMMSASIYASTSDYEGISNSMLEAMALGVPTICTDCPVGGARLVIENNINGILVSVKDTEGFYKAMLKVVSDDEFSKEISKEAVKVKERFSIKKIEDQWIDII